MSRPISHGMAINLGAEIALAIHLDQALTYGDIESALVDAGFNNYTIMRTLNFGGSADVQLFIRAPQNEDGSMQTLPSAETLTQLADAMTSMESAEPAPPVTPADNTGGGDTPAPAPADNTGGDTPAPEPADNTGGDTPAP